jgi:hypothetical protein
MWCHGNTCLVRLGDDVFASGLETLQDYAPLNNCRWTLFQREPGGWQFASRPKGPHSGTLSAGLLLRRAGADVGQPDADDRPESPRRPGSARDPEVRRRRRPKAPYKTLLPQWSNSPRSPSTLTAASPPTASTGNWSSSRTSATRTVLLGVSRPARKMDHRQADVVASRGSLQGALRRHGDARELPERGLEGSGRAFPGQLGLRPVGADARRGRLATPVGPAVPETLLHLVGRHCSGEFSDWVEIDNCYTTGGWLFSCDLHVAADGDVHMLWHENPIHPGCATNGFPTSSGSGP